MSGIASYIDHTLLKPDASREEILAVCKEAVEHKFASVCTNPLWTALVHNTLKGSGVKTCSVIGFPFGATPTDVKVYEARGANLDGADEIDMVINIAAARANDRNSLYTDIAAVADAVHAGGAALKVILETHFLTDEQKTLVCEVAAEAGADFVKTTTVEDIALMRKAVGPELGVKASGGIRSLEDARAMLEAGATRIGASSSVAIVNGEQAASAY
jgi:deoxyribose-phosphate aldolase